MLGFSYIKAVYDHTPYLHGREKYFHRSRHSSASPIRKSASQQKTYLIKKYGRSDTIRCLDSYILFYIIRVIIFAAGWVSLHGRLSCLVVPHSNNLVSLKQIFTIVYSL